MDNQTAAASSPAEVQDVFGGKQVTLDEYNEYRQSGKTPARFKSAVTVESAPTDAPEETVDDPEGDEPESVPESDPEETQEHPPKGSGAEKRIKQLLAEKKELQRKLEAAKPTHTDPSPAQAQQQQQHTRPKPTMEDKNPDGTPKYGAYEEFVEELADWKAEQRWVANERSRAAQAQAKELEAKVEDARTRYDDFDDVIRPFVNEFVSDPAVSPIAKQMVNDSEVFADLVYTLAGDDKFIAIAQKDPGKAIRYIARVEQLIGEELAGKADSKAAAKRTEGESAPEVKKTSAPKPPSPVGGTSSRAFDVSDDSLSADEWFRKRNQQLDRRGR